VGYGPDEIRASAAMMERRWVDANGADGKR